MNKRLLIVVGFAFFVALGATLLLYGLILRFPRTQAQAVTPEIVVAANDLQRGVLIKDLDVKTVTWGSSTLPKGAFTKKEDVINRGVVSEMAEGEPIVESRLAAKGTGAGLAPAIPKGMRAVSLRVNDVVAVAGYVIPGSKVDVLITGNPPGGNPDGSELRTILQNVEVLAAGTDIRRDSEGKPVSVPVITVLVTPEQAETISLATQQTSVQLVLRNPLDAEKAVTKGTDVAELFRGEKKPPKEGPAAKRKVVVAKVVPTLPPPPPPPPPVVVELLRGPARTQEKFQ